MDNVLFYTVVETRHCYIALNIKEFESRINTLSYLIHLLDLISEVDIQGQDLKHIDGKYVRLLPNKKATFLHYGKKSSLPFKYVINAENKNNNKKLLLISLFSYHFKQKDINLTYHMFHYYCKFLESREYYKGHGFAVLMNGNGPLKMGLFAFVGQLYSLVFTGYFVE